MFTVLHCGCQLQRDGNIGPDSKWLLIVPMKHVEIISKKVQIQIHLTDILPFIGVTRACTVLYSFSFAQKSLLKKGHYLACRHLLKRMQLASRDYSKVPISLGACRKNISSWEEWEPANSSDYN